MTTGSGAGMEAVTTGITNVMTIAGSILTEITSNTLLTVILAGGFVGLGAAVLRKVIRVSKAV